MAVVITGANSDIGKAVIGAYLNMNRELYLLDQVSHYEELRERYRNYENVAVYSLDLNDDKEVDAFKQVIQHEFKDVGVLINIAGLNILKSFLESDRETLDKVIRINATNTLIFTQSVIPKMITRNGAHIIFIGSQHGVVANYDRVPYSISKSILIQMTKSLALELANFNIKVNCVSPTFVLMETNQELLHSPMFQINALQEIPLEKYVIPEEVADAIVFLTSEQNKSITGHNLLIDGGWTIK